MDSLDEKYFNLKILLVVQVILTIKEKYKFLHFPEYHTKVSLYLNYFEKIFRNIKSKKNNETNVLKN